MKISEIIAKQKELELKLEMMTPEERKEFWAASERHSQKVKEEIKTSHKLENAKKKE